MPSYQEYLASDEWKGLDLFPRRVYRKSFPLRFAVFQAWSAKYEPELGDALTEALLCSEEDKPFMREIMTMIRIIGYSSKKKKEYPKSYESRRPTKVECRACGYVWEPEDLLRTHKCALCGDWWLRML